MSQPETTELSEHAQDVIDRISKAYGTPEPELVEQLREYTSEFEEKGFPDAETRALRKLALDEKGGAMGSVEDLRGMVLGVGDPIDTTNNRVENAKRYIEKRGVQSAAQQGMVKKAPDPEMLDGLATITVDGDPYLVLDSRSNSPNQGEILPEHDYIRWVHGAVWRGEEGPYKFSGVINADEAGDVPPVPPKYAPVNFRATYREDDETGEVRLGFQDEDPFEVNEEADIPFEKVAEALGVLPLAEVASYSERPGFDRNETVITKGSVTYMELAPDEGQSRRLTLVDPFDFEADPRVTVWLPEHHTVNYGEQSDVYVVGQVSPSQSDQYDDSVEARGVWVDPDYRVERDAVGSFSADAADEGADEGEDTGGGEPAEEAQEEASEKLSPEETPDLHEGEPEPPSAEQIAEADYNELRGFAASYEDVPGSGIAAPKLRKMLMSLRNRYDAGEFDAPDEEPPADDEIVEEVREGQQEPSEPVAEPDDGEGLFEEPAGEDDEWSW